MEDRTDSTEEEMEDRIDSTEEGRGCTSSGLHSRCSSRRNPHRGCRTSTFRNVLRSSGSRSFPLGCKSLDSLSSSFPSTCKPPRRSRSGSGYRTFPCSSQVVAAAAAMQERRTRLGSRGSSFRAFRNPGRTSSRSRRIRRSWRTTLAACRPSRPSCRTACSRCSSPAEATRHSQKIRLSPPITQPERAIRPTMQRYTRNAPCSTSTRCRSSSRPTFGRT